MMDQSNILNHVKAYHDNGQTLDAAKFLIRTYQLEDENLAGFDIQKDVPKGQILMTAVGSIPGKQIVNIPDGVFKYNFNLVLNLLMHEMLHVRQKAPENPVFDKNEREFQAYYEMLFHEIFPNIPDAPVSNRIEFAEKALVYYHRMGHGSELQTKYTNQQEKVQELLTEMQSVISSKTTNNQA